MYHALSSQVYHLLVLKEALCGNAEDNVKFREAFVLSKCK